MAIFTLNINPEIATCDSGMDVVFIFDYTASMSPQIEAVKTGVIDIISTITTESGANDYRLGLVIADETTANNNATYFSNTHYTSLPVGQKIINNGSSKYQWITAMEMMTPNNETSFTIQLNKLNGDLPLGTGWNPPEPTDIALSEVIENSFVNSFRDNVAKYVIIITDASPGGDDDIFTQLDIDEINRLASVCNTQGIKAIVLGAGVESNLDSLYYPWKTLANSTGGSWNSSYDATTIQTEITNNCSS